MGPKDQKREKKKNLPAVNSTGTRKKKNMGASPVGRRAGKADQGCLKSIRTNGTEKRKKEKKDV